MDHLAERVALSVVVAACEHAHILHADIYGNVCAVAQRVLEHTAPKGTDVLTELDLQPTGAPLLTQILGEEVAMVGKKGFDGRNVKNIVTEHNMTEQRAIQQRLYTLIPKNTVFVVLAKALEMPIVILEAFQRFLE